MQCGHFEHRRDQGRGHQPVAGGRQVHAVEGQPGIGEIDGFSQVDVPDSPLVRELPLQHAHELVLLLQVALAQRAGLMAA